MIKEEALKKAKYNDYWFLRECQEWNNDKEIMLSAVQQSEYALKYASDELRNSFNCYCKRY